MNYLVAMKQYMSREYYHGFEMRILITHPDYLEETFGGVAEEDFSMKDYIVSNIQFEGDMYYQLDRDRFKSDYEKYYDTNFAMLESRYSDDDKPYFEDIYDKFYIIDPEHRRTEDEITSQLIDSIEEIMSWVYKDFNFSQEIKTDLTTILDCMYWDYTPYLNEDGEFDIRYLGEYSDNYKNKILSIKWQNTNLEDRHEIYVNTYPNCRELIIR